MPSPLVVECSNECKSMMTSTKRTELGVQASAITLERSSAAQSVQGADSIVGAVVPLIIRDANVAAPGRLSIPRRHGAGLSVPVPTVRLVESSMRM